MCWAERAADATTPRQGGAEYVQRHSRSPVWLDPGDQLGEWPEMELEHVQGLPM